VIAVIDTSKQVGAVSSEAAKAPAAESSKAPASATDAGAALPAARKMLAESNVHAADVSGTGRGGRVTKGDVIDHLSGASAKPASVPVSAPAVGVVTTGERVEQRVPMSRLRQRVAERLVQSQSTAAILSTFNEVNMKPVMDLRTRYKDSFEKAHGVKLGFMS